jgi:hypothetical protein
MFKKMKVKYIKTSQNVHIYWQQIDENLYRWRSFECNLPVWWKPKFEKFSAGIRFGWLVFAFGIGVVTKEQMDALEKHKVE